MSASVAAPPRSGEGALSNKPLKLLFVDDEPRILRSMRMLFRDHDVTVSNDPRQAVEIARDNDFDVVVSDQRMPDMTGAEVLREVRSVAPRSMRVLLTGYSDLQAVLGSVNEGEVFRYVNKPWVNKDLRATVFLAGKLARETPAPSLEDPTEDERREALHKVGVIAIQDDAVTKTRLRDILSEDYVVRFADSPESALAIMEQQEIGVLISETTSRKGDVTALLKAVKHLHPYIASVVITERANAQVAIDLINEGQVFRMLLKPVRPGSCKLSVHAAMKHYLSIKKNPSAAKRYAVTPDASSLSGLGEALLTRIRQLPNRLMRQYHRPAAH